MRVRFSQVCDVATQWRKNGTPMAVTRYPADFEGTIKREWAEDAIAQGKAVEVPVQKEPSDGDQS